VGKVYNLCRVKTNISAALTVKSGLDTHMIIKFKVDLNQYYLFIDLLIYVVDYLPLIFYLWVGIYLHVANACLIKTLPTKHSYHSQTMSAFSLIIALHVI
jgi:hypothetical protein